MPVLSSRLLRLSAPLGLAMALAFGAMNAVPAQAVDGPTDDSCLPAAMPFDTTLACGGGGGSQPAPPPAGGPRTPPPTGGNLPPLPVPTTPPTTPPPTPPASSVCSTATTPIALFGGFSTTFTCRKGSATYSLTSVGATTSSAVSAGQELVAHYDRTAEVCTIWTARRGELVGFVGANVHCGYAHADVMGENFTEVARSFQAIVDHRALTGVWCSADAWRKTYPSGGLQVTLNCLANGRFTGTGTTTFAAMTTALAQSRGAAGM